MPLELLIWFPKVMNSHTKKGAIVLRIETISLAHLDLNCGSAPSNKFGFRGNPILTAHSVF